MASKSTSMPSVARKAFQHMAYQESRLLFALTIAAITWSFWGNAGLKIWLLEAGPVLVGLPVIAYYRKRFPLTPLLYRLLFFGSCLLVMGAHYTYARVPFGNWLRETFHLQRNHYDRVGHFFQGFVPAILFREILLRNNVVRRGFWLSGIVVAICLACSAYYELLEWFAARSGLDNSGDFMGAQGDVYDAQWDMFLALLGSCLSLVFLGEEHDHELAQMGEAERPEVVVRRKYQ